MRDVVGPAVPALEADTYIYIYTYVYIYMHIAIVIGGSIPTFGGYPLVNLQKTMENNHHF